MSVHLCVYGVCVGGGGGMRCGVAVGRGVGVADCFISLIAPVVLTNIWSGVYNVMFTIYCILRCILSITDLYMPRKGNWQETVTLCTQDSLALLRVECRLLQL